MKKNQFEEVPSQRKIIENRRFPGLLKVFAAWYLFWNTLHQIAWDLFSAVVLCNVTLSICPNSDRVKTP
ncbi:hypothetical protein S7335_1250 [Synechococcus sp. PCC 7335]|uniref:hypothetical protein n=1 Tax=Synechococcus sp. (strain ATCC 29403 / PCC 7335) TaxID=91464 RepID=UPI00017EB928|nr:hypothetical protein [Synechococcus sp. PCC 7335]EDX82546.1 hypothetical protein S7335_1250 [Synechococcus sp. PCC 7335]